MLKICAFFLAIYIVGFTLAQHRHFRIAVYDDYDDNFERLPPPPPPPPPTPRRRVPVEVKIPTKKAQDFSKIPGSPGIDYPLYHTIPKTHFSCSNVPYVPGMYANVETGCQVYHVCHDGREGQQGASFLCSNGTLFNQREFACDWWYNVNCAETLSLYSLNGDLTTNPFVPKERQKAIQRERLRIAVF